jgi:hypothetical protein
VNQRVPLVGRVVGRGCIRHVQKPASDQSMSVVLPYRWNAGSRFSSVARTSNTHPSAGADADGAVTLVSATATVMPRYTGRHAPRTNPS